MPWGRTSHLTPGAAPFAKESAIALPLHDDFSLPRRASAVLSITTAAGLLAIHIARLIVAIDSFHWFVPLAVIGGMIAADFLSGLIHWSADTWGSESMPIIGRRLLHPFRVHHVNPDDFLRRRFIDTNGDVAFLVVPILVAAYFIPLGTAAQRAVALFVTSFCGIGLLTNQVHQWAHMTEPPFFVKALQDCGAILGRNAHARHHRAPYVDNYCIATGWCNRPLAAINFFRRLERIVTHVTGWQPRSDDSAFQSDVETRCQGQCVIDLTFEPERSHA